MNKIKKRRMNKGISLIVLVITIIVIIILVAAVILSMDDNNPIENAKKAKQKHNESVYQEELELYTINEYSNGNSGFDKDVLNVFDGKDVKKYIKSMLDEDVDKYIIWQGRLVKKDGDVYKYINNEKVTLLDGTPLTDNMIEFAKIVQETDLLYNGGYITNIPEGQLVSDFKERLGNDIVIKKYNEVLKQDNLKMATEDLIFDKNDNLLAKVIIYGDTDRSGSITGNDNNRIDAFVGGNDMMSIAQKISADANHDGIIDKNDTLYISKVVATLNSDFIKQDVPPTLPKNI